MGKMRGKSAGATVQGLGNTQPKNAGMPILKQYEIHLRNAQDGYAYAGLQCYSGKDQDRHRGRFWRSVQTTHQPQHQVNEQCTGHTGFNIQHAPDVSCMDYCCPFSPL